MNRISSLMVTLIAGLLAGNLWACGDSLYRVGKGISYRVYTAPLPGSVLVYGKSEGATQLAEALAKSGHNVEVVDSEIDLSLRMNQGGYDVVIAAYSDHDTVASSAQASGATYLPVVPNKEEARLVGQSYGEVMVADRDDIRDYLKAIHKTLKSKA